MKRIIFPATNRVHLARQKLLLDELRKCFEVDVFEPKSKSEGMGSSAIFCAVEFRNALILKDYDCALIRGDRYELLGVAMAAAYRGIPIVHIEGGDLSGNVIDSKVRHAITNLSDYHFATNEEALARLISMGVPTDRAWNYGSLDAEFAISVPKKRMREDKYVLVAYHPIAGEDEKELDRAIEGLNVARIKSNSDYGRTYGDEEFLPEEYINMMRYADCCVGNSSSFIKEASVLGVGVVNVGDRQTMRLKPKNVLDTPCKAEKIRKAIDFQSQNRYDAEAIYLQGGTSRRIADTIRSIFL